MTNIFLSDYYSRLQEWHNLRQNLINSNVKEICIAVDNFWQQAPLNNHYLHPHDMREWPTPWQLLNDNNYCYYARALGMIYTLILLGTKKVELVEAKDDNNNEVVLVLVDNAKYVLNYWPDSVVNNHITDFVITRTYDILPLYSKIG